MTADREAEALSTAFHCPNCAAEYRLVRMMAEDKSPEHEIVCIACGSPLSGREGAFLLKYFFIDRRSNRRRTISPVRIKASG